MLVNFGQNLIVFNVLLIELLIKRFNRCVEVLDLNLLCANLSLELLDELLGNHDLLPVCLAVLVELRLQVRIFLAQILILFETLPSAFDLNH